MPMVTTLKRMMILLMLLKIKICCSRILLIKFLDNQGILSRSKAKMPKTNYKLDWRGASFLFQAKTRIREIFSNNNKTNKKRLKNNTTSKNFMKTIRFITLIYKMTIKGALNFTESRTEAACKIVLVEHNLHFSLQDSKSLKICLLTI